VLVIEAEPILPERVRPNGLSVACQLQLLWLRLLLRRLPQLIKAADEGSRYLSLARQIQRIHTRYQLYHSPRCE
jgi:hypothetical protein